MKKTIYASPLGLLLIKEEAGMIMEIDFVEEAEGTSETPLLLEAKRQLEEYFRKERRSFSLPMNPKGTEFQKKVWRELLKIPYGQTSTYGEIAVKIGSPRGARSVGSACNKNPLAIVIPCHRVLGKNGELVGYASGLDIKAKLFELEN